MAAPLSKAAPPPATREKRAQRRRQRRLVLGTLATFLLAAVAWQVYDYVASAPIRAEAQVQKGIQSLIPGRYETAVSEFTQALETDPNSWNAYLQRGLANQNLGKLDDALADYGRALQIKPDALEALTARAGIYREKGDAKRTIEELSKVIALKPEVAAYYSRGLSYAEVGQHEAAISDFTWVVERVRDAPLAYLARAKSKRAMGDEKGAASDEFTANHYDRGRAQ